MIVGGGKKRMKKKRKKSCLPRGVGATVAQPLLLLKSRWFLLGSTCALRCCPHPSDHPEFQVLLSFPHLMLLLSRLLSTVLRVGGSRTWPFEAVREPSVIGHRIKKGGSCKEKERNSPKTTRTRRHARTFALPPSPSGLHVRCNGITVPSVLTY